MGGLTGEAEDRSCTWEGLATAVTITAVTALIFAKKLDVAFNGESLHTSHGYHVGVVLTVAILGNLITLGTAVGLIVWGVACGVSAVLNWIFPHLNDQPDCILPHDYFVYYTTCVSYRAVLLGGGSSIGTTTWFPGANTGLTAPVLTANTIVGSATFTSPILTPPSLSTTVIITPAIHTCDGNTLTNTLSVTFLPTTVDNAFPSAVSFALAPTTATYNTVVQYWVSPSSSYAYQSLSWDFPDGGASIVEQGDYWIKVSFWLTGSRRLRATLTNTCTGISGSAEVTVQVNQ